MDATRHCSSAGPRKAAVRKPAGGKGEPASQVSLICPPLRQYRRYRRQPRNLSGLCLFNGDSVYVQRLSQGLIESDLGVRVVRHRLDFSALESGEVALGLNDRGRSGLAELEPVLLGIQSLFREYSRSNSGLIAGARLLQADHDIADFHADLAGCPLKLQFVLAQLKLIGNVVRLRRAVAERNIQRKTGRIVRIMAPEDLSEERPVSAH